MSGGPSREPQSTAAGFLAPGEDGVLRFGAACVRGWPWRLDSGGIAEEVPEETIMRGVVVPRSYRWDDITRAGLRVRPTVSVPLLLKPWRDFEFRLEVRTLDGKGWFLYQHHLLERTDSRLHTRVMPALVQYLIATPDARKGLDDPGRVELLVERIAGCIADSVPQPRATQRWPGASRRRRRELDAAAVEVLAQRDVVLYGGRPVNGARMEATPQLIDAVIVDWAEHVAGDLPGDDVVAAALDAMQGPHPDWPFDVLVQSSGGT